MIKVIEGGGICSPQGFLAAGAAVGIKASGKPDLAIIASRVPARVAGSFTQNVFTAAPVVYCREVVEAGKPVGGIVVNSGCANACTGEEGLTDTREMARVAARFLGFERAEEVLVSSTGRIGTRLPMELIAKGIDKTAGLISDMGSNSAAAAIMTTDTFPKSYAVEVEIGGVAVTVGGIAKGAGMIAPAMKTVPHATMLAYLTTDALVAPPALSAILEYSVDRSFNRVTVDGDTSTNDTVLLLANGVAGNPEVQLDTPEFEVLAKAVETVAAELGKMMARDGEGATKLVTVAVSGAASDAEASHCARAIADSLLCKTAWFGCDPNWGRILDVAGYCGVAVDPDKVNLSYDSVPVVVNGRDAGTPEAQQAAVLKQTDFAVNLDLGVGDGSGWMWTCDLTYEYVKINADYRT